MKRVAGTLIAVLLAVAGIGAIVSSSAESSGTYRVDAIFDTAKGVIPGQVVKIAGARVGLIDDVKLTPQYKARIVMSVPRRFEFRDDASCNIQPEGLISENFVQCDPGTPGKPDLKGEPAPTVPVGHTSVPVSITDLFRVFQADVRQRFTVAMMALGGGLASRGGDLNNIILRSSPTLRAVRQLMRDLAAQKAQLSSAVADTDRVIAQLAARKGRVADFVEQAAQVSRQAADHRGRLAETIRRLPPLLDRSDRAIGDLNRFFDNSQPLLGELRAAAPGLNRVLEDLPPFARAAQPSLVELGRTARVGRRTLTDVAPLAGLLRTFTTQSGPAGRALADTLVNLRQRGGVEYLLRFIYYVAAATSRFDATSHILPVHVVEGGSCSLLATTPSAGCNAFYRGNPATRRASRAAVLKQAKAIRKRAIRTREGAATAPAAKAPAPAATARPGATTAPVPAATAPARPAAPAQPAATPAPGAVQDLADFLLGK